MKSKSYLLVIIGFFILSACSGGQEQTVAYEGDVVPSGEAQEVTPTDVTASAGDETITPSGTPSSPDDPSSQIPSNDVPPAPEAPSSASIVSFQVTKVASARLGTVKIEWSFANAKAAYLWGDFNREADDADCKLKDGRHLVTGPDGNKLNEGSALYNQNLPFLEGVPCNNA
ncbi:MAG TPA: hypothetical protein VFX30_08225, partial [bacterium]|nr:hypothetical protein [bacterium]